VMLVAEAEEAVAEMESEAYVICVELTARIIMAVRNMPTFLIIWEKSPLKKLRESKQRWILHFPAYQ